MNIHDNYVVIPIKYKYFCTFNYIRGNSLPKNIY